MKRILKNLLIALLIISGYNASATSITKSNGMGYTTTLQNVICNSNSTYTIQMLVSHNGCSGPKLSHLSIQASPGSYSNIQVQKISGKFTYGSIALGPNLGASTPFQGFKVDGTGNIGDGDPGSFKVTYTITSLQSQQVSAKAGTSFNIVTFSVVDFNYVMMNNNTSCSLINYDTDGDGCLDSNDTYPNDSLRCYNTTKSGSLAFEDLWPSRGDYDFNDLVIDYTIKSVANSNNKVIDIEAKFIVKAFGAGYNNGFGFQLPNSLPQSNFSVTGYKLYNMTVGSNGLENGQNKPTFIAFDKSFSIMRHPGSSIGVNTTPGAPYVTPDTITLHISVKPNTYTISDLGVNNFNPFIFIDGVRSHEVHLPNYSPTSLVDMSLFGTFEDDSKPSEGRYYVTKNNIPWSINIPETFDYPKEKVSIIDTYTKFADWAGSNGEQYKDWYKNLTGYRNTNSVY